MALSPGILMIHCKSARNRTIITPTVYTTHSLIKPDSFTLQHLNQAPVRYTRLYTYIAKVCHFMSKCVNV